MSHDVLDGLRRLVALADDTLAERRPSETASLARARTEGPSTETLRSDGGEPRSEDDEHLRDLPDGAGCTEIWEHLSERQAEDGAAEEGRAEESRARECRADD